VGSFGALGFASLLTFSFFSSRPPGEYGHELVLTHVVATLVAIGIGAFQFISEIRLSWPCAHRWTGRIYVTASLLGATCGVFLAAEKATPDPTSFGLVVTASFWFLATTLGFRAVRQRNFPLHLQWMIRSYALAMTALTLRLYEHGVLYVGIRNPKLILALSVWAALITNLALAELVVFKSRKWPAPAIRSS
jgi:predicted membrane protein DUF2306